MQEHDEFICRLHAEFCTLLSNETRVRIFCILQDGEKAVTELAERAGVSIQNTSQHLRVMRDKGAVVSRRNGKQVYYRIANPKFLEGARLIREGILEELRRKAGRTVQSRLAAVGTATLNG